jgi:tRNA-2-methylthio-N6-dimethylallyladenosine synthase
MTKITLLGQNVNAYKYGEIDFTGLLKQVNAVNGLEEFSFVTSHPKDTPIELFKSMAECNRLIKYLHLPVQSGSDRILKAMNRGYTRKFYLDLAANYRTIVPNGALTTDIIVGFPGETEEDFQDTFDLVKQVEFEASFIFKYSSRPRTEASRLADDVPKEEKERRHALILQLQKKISRSKDAPSR